MLGALGVDTPAYEEAFALLQSGRHPFESVSRRVAGLDEADDLLQTMAGEGEPPPLHAVIAPWRGL